jgi:hypothetical protein
LGIVLDLVAIASSSNTADTDVTSMDFNASDILFLVVVLSLAIAILNNGDWGGGGGRRARVPAECRM